MGGTFKGKKELQPNVWLKLSSSTHDVELTKIFHILANSFPPDSAERFGKSFCESSMTI
jgi:hypothetical protein